MDEDSRELKDGLRAIVSWINFQKKITKWSLIAVALMILLGGGASIYLESRLKHIVSNDRDPKDWYDVSTLSKKGELEKALRIADDLLIRTPRDFEGHYRKGEILLMMNEPEKAKASFEAAYVIFPIPKYKSAVDALSKR